MVERRDRIRVHIEGKEFSVVGGSFQEMLATVKNLPGRRFVGELKVWQLPGSVAELQPQIESRGFQLEGGQEIGPVDTTQPAAPRPGGDRIRITAQGRQLAVVGGTFQEMLAAVKNLPGRRFDGDTKTWEIPGELPIIKQLIEGAGFQLGGADDVAAASVTSGAPATPPAPMESPDFGPPAEPPAYEAPDFLGDDDIPPYEPPDWWDDDNAPPPPVEPPDWWEEPDEAAPPEASQFAEPPAPAPLPATVRSTGSSDQIRIRIGGIPHIVTGGSFREMLTAVKNLPGRRFDGQDKVWDIAQGEPSERLKEFCRLNKWRIVRAEPR